MSSTLQGSPQGELLDLSEVEGSISVTLAEDVRAIAEFDNLVGLYVVEDAEGTVDGLAPGEEGYAAAALESAVDDFLLRGGSQGNTGAEELGSIDLEGGSIYAPFVIANGGGGTVADFLAANPNNSAGADISDPVAYFPYMAPPIPME